MISFEIDISTLVGRNMLFFHICRPLGCASFVSRITLARKFINNRTFLAGRNGIHLNGWEGFPSTVNNTRIDSKEAFNDGLFHLTFK